MVEGSSVTSQQEEQTHIQLSSHSFQAMIIKLRGWGDPGENFHASALLCKSLLIEFPH